MRARGEGGQKGPKNCVHTISMAPKQKELLHHKCVDVGRSFSCLLFVGILPIETCFIKRLKSHAIGTSFLDVGGASVGLNIHSLFQKCLIKKGCTIRSFL